LAGGEQPDHLVVIGASAGGIEALSCVLSMLPRDFPAPVVVAQHQEPARSSMLADVLRRASALPVRTMTGMSRLERGIVFVVPAGRHAEVVGQEVSLLDADRPGPKPSVDRLLTSAAAAFGEGLVAVILSGSGSDGAAGARAVKERGGTVIIENPATAKFPGMPQSLSPSTVDMVADLERIGSLLAELLGGALAAVRPDTAAALDPFLDEVRKRSGINFHTYKPGTIWRRLQRRLAATGARSLEEYQGYLQGHPEEYQRLVASFLIKVTEFFRDPDLFTHLRRHVLPDVIRRARERGDEIRLWSAGCATGEEAYSLAMVLCEALGDELERVDVRLFATDIDLDAVAFARRGRYPASALSGVSADLTARYFTEEAGEYQITKRLRSLLIFGQHDLGQRPPFPNVDLILCRNVLMYFTPELQQRALQLFAFALRDAGYLVLGKTEIASPFANFLRLEDPVLKIYRRHGGAVVLPPAHVDEVRRVPPLREVLRRPPPGERDPLRRSLPSNRVRSQLERLNEALLNTPVGVAVVDAAFDIQFINGTARNLLGIHGPASGEDLVHAARNAPPRRLQEVIDRAFSERATARLDRVEIEEPRSGQSRYVDLICVPVPQSEGGEGPGLCTLSIVDVTVQVEQEHRLAHLAERVERLTISNRDLASANERLAALNTELQTANTTALVNTEEVQAASEEVETLNEELQATNEELETLNEELQATVEELNTANDDLRARSLELQDLALARERQREEIARAKDYLEVVVASMGAALLAVDAQGRTIMANRAYEHLWESPASELRMEDLEGRVLPQDSLPERRAARGEAFMMEFVVIGRDGVRRWYEAVGNPLRHEQEPGSLRTRPGGGVVVIRDVTDRTLRRLQDEFLAVASHELRTPISAISLYAGLLARLHEPGEPDAKARGLLDALLVETRRLGLLVNDLMDVVRLQSGQVVLHRQRVDLVALIRRVADLAQHLARGQTIAMDLPDGEVFLDADSNRLEQVIMNLLENAMVYAEGTQRIDLRLRVAEHRAQVMVQDYGPGIPAAELPHVFDRFFRSTSSVQRPAGGLGLGLYIVHQLVSSHGGTIDVRSTEGSGAVFTISLPLSDSG
jgi:two-component system CheB/CheR fusion protein